MNAFYRSRFLPISGLLLGVLVWLANNANPPNGKTAAPFDGTCAECHSGNNPGGFDGIVDISGLPSTIQSNTTYPMTLTMTPTAGTPIKGGFQLVVVDGNNNNAGDLISINAQTGTETLAGREYIEHRNGKVFGGNPISWNFNWKSPVTAAGNTIKFYFIGNFTNNNNSDTGDKPIAASQIFDFAGPPPLSASITNTTNVACFGGNTGSATVDAAGGILPYSYLWSNGQTTQTAINLMAGNYSVTVTGSAGSGTATASTTITQPPALAASAVPSGTLTCAQTSVNVTANVSGGTAPYTENWSNGSMGNPAVYTTAGSGSVTVTDNNGCTKVAVFNITSNTVPPNANAGPAGTLTCTQSQITLNGNGSSVGAIYSYLWTTQNGNIVSGATTLTPVVNAAGTYTIQVTNSVNGCTATASTTVTSNINPPDLTATGGTITCSNPSVTLNANSNTSGVTYAWTGPNGFTSNLQNPTVSVAGTYIVTVTNPANNCTNSANVIVMENVTPPAVTASTSGQITCTTLSVQLNASNVTGGIYAWTGPGNYTSSQQNPTVTIPGTYTVTVTGTNGCTGTATATVIQNITPPGATATANGEITCSNNTVGLNGGSGAAPNVTFAWTGPNNYTSSLQNPVVNTPGVYNLTVTSNANGCTSTATVTVVQNNTPPVANIATPGNLNCHNATIQINASGSSQGPNFTYAWTTGNGNIVSGANTLTPIVDAAGTYNLLITNTTTGCTSTGSTTVNQTPPVTVSATAVNVSCNGGSNGSATATPGGGTGNFTYLWSNSATTSNITGLTAGSYSVTISDGENCTATATVTVTQPVILLANATATGETALGANDGTATAAPTGGTPGYTYLWSVNNQTTATITGLAPGNYTVTTTDANNCTAVQTVTVNSFNCALSASISSVNISCNGAANGTATVNLTGQVDPVVYIWSNGDSTQSVSGLAPGTYTVSITDANNCPASLSVNITQPPVLAANATATPETATGANDGTATAQPTGGTPPYSYLWSNGATTATITGLTPGSYSVTVMDGNNCSSSQTVIVNAFNCSLTANISAVNVVCANETTGQATVTLEGGELPFDYLWTNGETTATISNLGIGTYGVVITDANGCITTDSVKIIATDNIPPTISCPGSISFCGADIATYSPPVVSDNCSLNGNQAVLISGLPSGSPFNDGVTTQVFQVTDVVGNTAQCSFTVTVFPLPDVLVNGIVNDTNNLGVGSIGITPVGGSLPYSFIWRKNNVFFSNDEDLTGLNAGSYSLTVIDGNGCSVMLAPVLIGNTVGTSEPGSISYIRLWPNPAQTSFRVDLNGLQPVSGQIFTPQGRLIKEIEQGELNDEVSVEQLPEGIYFLRVVEKNGAQAMVKWVKAN